MKFAFINAHRRRWPVRIICRVLKVTRSGFYAWLNRPTSPRATRRTELAARIRVVHKRSGGVYGSPRIHRVLMIEGQNVCVNTVAKIMHEEQIQARKRRKFVPRTTDSAHRQPVAANVLDRQFDTPRPDRKWAADITCIPTAEGWLYLAGVIDLCTRRIVGWSMADHMRADLVTDALAMALARRRPAAGLMHHSDRGGQYACDDYQAVLAAHGVTCSMSRRGNCWDNAVIESFWATLKTELVHGEQYATREQARASIFQYIEVFYNRKRLHSSLGYKSPEAFEASLN